ncbi:MAG: alanine dehydrogenase [Dongiaceae bacterium]
MRIGVPSEIKNHEYRVGMIPGSVKELVRAGHEVFVENNAGIGIGKENREYEAAGAKILPTAAEIFAKADMIVKVKEPQESEYKLLREGQILFTYLHLAADLKQTKALMDSGCVAIAYETVTDAKGGLPLLAPMSEVAGRMSIQVGARCLEKPQGGAGMLLGGVPGVAPARVVIIGGGVVGTNALWMATGMGARVTVIDKSVERLHYIDAQYRGAVTTLYSTYEAIEENVKSADLVIGAVLVHGAAAPKLVSEAMIKSMHPGAVVVDVAIDQGGCFETSQPTSHQNPTFVKHDVVHYCVTNMPGAVSRTSSFALNNATLPFTMALANKGWKKACQDDAHLANGLNVCLGKLTYPAVAEDLNLPYTPLTKLVA